MDAQCCTSSIFTLKCRYLSLTHIFSAISENSLQMIHCGKLDSLGYIFITDTKNLTSTILMQFAAKATKFGHLVQNNGHCTFKLIQGHQCWYQLKVLPMTKRNSHYLRKKSLRKTTKTAIESAQSVW